MVLLWRRPRLKRPLLAFWVLVIVALCFAPGLYTVAWHLRHGNTIRYRGKWIPVPARWIADAEPQGAMLDEVPISLFTRRVPDTIMMGPSFPKGSDSGKNRKIWEKVFLLARPNAAVPAPHKIETPQGKIFCLQFLGKTASETSDVSCLMFQNTWVVEFIGNKNDLDQFASVIRSMR